MQKVIKKVRFRNRAKSLQVIYDENGVKKEIIPQGVVELTPEWGSRFRCLEPLPDPAKPAKKDE